MIRGIMKMRLLMWLLFITSFSYELLFTYDAVLQVRSRNCEETASRFSFIKKIVATNCYLSLVRRKGDGRLFLVKQKKRVVRIPLSIFESVLADLIARTIENLHSQEVFVVSAGCDFPGKHALKLPASVHTLVPGKSIQEWKRSDNNSLKAFFKNFHLRQNIKVSQTEKVVTGITEEIIKTMALHSDLPSIAAYHTLLGYYDGHNGNVFYDPVSGHFYIIDMDSICKANLCKISYKNIQEMIKDNKVKFNKHEIQALISFVDTLRAIMEKNPLTQIDKLVKEIGLQLGEEFMKRNRVTVILTMEQIKRFFRESYEYADQLISIMHKLIEVKSIEEI